MDEAPRIRFDLLTAHPELVRSPLDNSILARGQACGAIAVGVHDIRNSATGRHRQIDDTPYGGGAGMVMKVDVVHRALEAVRRPESRVLLMSPSGPTFTQRRARALARERHLVLLCGPVS